MFERRRARAEGAWLVTGAASGFGRAMAKKLAERGETLALWDRNADGLAETRSLLEGARVHLEAVDVTDSDGVRDALERSATALGSIAHVFHSAGVLAVGRARDVSVADYRRMIEVNYLGSVHVALASLPYLERAAGERAGGERAAGEGEAKKSRATLTLVASIAGLRGLPGLAGYSASKCAVVGFAQGLADELSGSGICVKVLCPPAGDTPMVRNLEKLPPIYKLSPLFSAEVVAAAALRELDRPGLLALVDVRTKAMWRAFRLAPGLVDAVVRTVR